MRDPLNESPAQPPQDADHNTTAKLMTEKHLLDIASIGTVAATFIGWLPHLAALASFIWSCIRIYETKTVQRWVQRMKGKK